MKTSRNQSVFLFLQGHEASFSNILSFLLKESGLKKGEIARQCGCSTQFVNMVLSGERTVSPTARKVKEAISQALGFNPWA